MSGSGKYVKGDRQAKKVITCYGCGEPGHIRPNCPNRIRRVRSSVSENQMEVDGWLAGKAVKGLRVDTGADRSVVSPEFVPEQGSRNRGGRGGHWPLQLLWRGGLAPPLFIKNCSSYI